MYDDDEMSYEERCGRCGRQRINCECLNPDLRDGREPYDRLMDRMDRSYDDWASS